MAGTRSLAWLSLLFAVALALLALSPLPLAADVEARGAAVVTPLAAGLRGAWRPVADVLLNAGQLRTLSAENAALRHEVARVEADNAALREQAITSGQVAALREAVSADGAGRYEPAAVLLRDPSPGRRALLIDRGRAHGVATGQPVLGPAATLVGVITEVQDTRARVRLLDDPHSAVAAVLQQSRVPGALAGAAGGAGALRLEFVPPDAVIAEGEPVLTSPIGGRLPAGVLIGRVVAVHADDQALFASVTVEAVTDYDRLERVLVMTSFGADALLPALPALPAGAGDGPRNETEAAP